MGAVKNCVKILYYKEFAIMEKNELIKLNEEAKKQYDELCKQGLKLDMSRGKPSPAQLDLSLDMLTHCLDGDYMSETGVDCRNYGVLDGIEEAKRLCMPMLGVAHDEIIIGGNSSLQLMYDTIAKAYTHGLLHSEKPWSKLDKIKWLCPAPGYDRHFKVTQAFGMELITVPMNDDGPDMDMVEEVVKDPAVKGMWCVPKYSNPDGIIYSDEVIDRIAHLKPAAADFLLMWDNAYCIHEFDGEFRPFRDILTLCSEAGNPDMVFEFASTSKVSFPGSGVSAMATSHANLEDAKKHYTIQTIGNDKVNQLRHARYFKNLDGLKEHMKKHADFMRPKFETTLKVLEEELDGLGIGSWIKPLGGYFISFDAMEGCAKAIVAKCKEAGVILTGAGATFPYHNDPKDSNIRIAPSFPTPEEMQQATEIFVLCVKLVSVEKLLAA